MVRVNTTFGFTFLYAARTCRQPRAPIIGQLDALIEEILLASRLEARGGASLDAEGVLLVDGNARLLRRALRNLIENALRHGGVDSPVEVSLRHDTSRTETLPVALTVCDRGPGVPQSERERIFEPFYRLRGASEAAGGTGLGLALVRTIITKHGGDVRCAAREGGGACFFLRLPVSTQVALPSP